MGARKTKNELEEIKKRNNAHYLFSWSRYKVSRDDLWSYYLKYIQGVQEDNIQNQYGMLGGEVHDSLENILKNEMTRQQAIDNYKEKSIELNIYGMRFDRKDDEKNDKIEYKYNYSNIHFLENFNVDELNRGISRCEFWMETKVKSVLFGGYIDYDQIITNEDGSVELIVTDFKTSSIYSGKKIESEEGQLLLYVLSYLQQGYTLDQIKARWMFTKYVTVNIQQKNGNMRTSQIMRWEISSKLQATVSMWLKNFKYTEDEIASYVEEMHMNNSIDGLPDEVKEKFEINDCYVYIDITQEKIDAFIEEVYEQVMKVLKLEIEFGRTNDDSIFMFEVTDKDSYFFANLCGYSRKLHKPYAKYLEGKELFLITKAHNSDDQDEMDELMKELGML